MLYVLHGEDFSKRAKKLEELSNFFLSKKPDAVFAKINPSNFRNYDLTALSEEQGLFENKCIVVLDGLLEEKEIKDEVLGRIKNIGPSLNIFIVNERSISKTDLAKIEKYSEKVQEFLPKEKPDKKEFNIFSLAEAIGGRDKRKAWYLYLKAVENGSEPEEIHGTIFWAIKNMAIVKNSDRPTPDSTGLKPFVFAKSRIAAEKYSKEEIKKLLSRLISLYHDSHRGIGDFSAGLEKLILESM